MKRKRKKRLWMYRRKWRETGEIQREQCTNCKSCMIFFDRYDALYCPRCDEWKEPVCGDPCCSFCCGRPDKPSTAVFLQADSKIPDSRFYIRRYERRYKKMNSRRLLKKLQERQYNKAEQ